MEHEAADDTIVNLPERVGAGVVMVSVHAPDVSQLVLTVRSPSDDDGGERHVEAVPAPDRPGTWVATVSAEGGDRYWLTADGVGPLVDPAADDVVFEDGRPLGVVRTAPWPRQPSLGGHHPFPVVYEMHVRGFARTFAGAIERLAHLSDLGVQVVELMPVHPFDTEGNHWGYMPVVWGAVHRPFAADADDAPGELAAFVAEAHRLGIEVWLDVVFNHTGEGSPDQPTWSLRGLDDAHAYRRRDDGSYTDDSGCGNDTNPADEQVRDLVLQALDRFADLGIDGFRFDLASLLSRDGGTLVRRIGDWADQRNVVLVAEAWDMGAYEVGHRFPDGRWAQWNDRFRDDVRGFLRSEPGLVPNMIQRVTGSPELFDGHAWRSLNFVTAHDGLTLHDLTAVTSDRHRSWDCGPDLRPQQIANAFSYLLMSAGPAMFVMGDEMARTQEGHDNPYDVDGPLTWLDWSRLDEWPDLMASVRRLVELRGLADFSHVACFGPNGAPDLGYESRTLAWSTGALYVIANAWWEPVTFTVQRPGPWHVAHTTAQDTIASGDGTVVAAPRSVTVLVHEGVPHDRRHPAQPGG
ncbi:MAG: alpha-amylase family glycosyl hydrolase [Ilumatobacteraceae bacterium]